MALRCCIAITTSGKLLLINLVRKLSAWYNYRKTSDSNYSEKLPTIFLIIWSAKSWASMKLITESYLTSKIEFIILFILFPTKGRFWNKERNFKYLFVGKCSYRHLKLSSWLRSESKATLVESMRKIAELSRHYPSRKEFQYNSFRVL